MKKPQLLLVFVTTFTMLLTGTNAMAKGPSIRPDWSKSSTHTINLSGQTVTFTIPGSTSTDFPSRITDNLNIYDPDNFNEWKSKELAKIWWDYKKKVLMLFPDMLGTLEISINLHDSTKESTDNLFQQGVLEETLKTYYKNAFPNSKDSNRLPDNFAPTEINGQTWLKYVNRGNKSNTDRLCYSIPISSHHFIEVAFRIIESKERNEENWYEIAQQDIEKMITSFTINYTKSAHGK